MILSSISYLLLFQTASFVALLLGMVFIDRFKRLSDNQQKQILASGLSHFSTAERIQSVTSQQTLTSNSGKIYFFFNDPIPYEVVKHNMQGLRKALCADIIQLTQLTVTDISEAQVQQMKIRRSDNAVIYLGNEMGLMDNTLSTELGPIVEFQPRGAYWLLKLLTNTYTLLGGFLISTVVTLVYLLFYIAASLN